MIPTLRLGLSKDIHDLSIGRILTQSPDQITALCVSDLHLIGWCPVKQLEGIFEVCEQNIACFFIRNVLIMLCSQPGEGLKILHI